MSTVFQRHIRDLSVTTISVLAFADLSIVIFFPRLKVGVTRKCSVGGRYICSTNPGGGGVLPYMGYMGMCRCEGYGFQAVYSRTGYINQSVWV